MLADPLNLILLVVSFVVPLAVLLVTMGPYLGFLTRKGRVVDDLHKTPPTKVPEPVGPILFVSAAIGETLVYLFFGTLVPVALLGAITVAFGVGIADDIYVLGPRTKPLLLVFAAVPLIAGVMLQPDLYESSLIFPIFGTTQGEHFTIYTLLILAAFPVVANAFNMMDAFNGELSGFSTLTSIALVFAIVLHALAVEAFGETFDVARLAAALPLVAVSIGFYFFNRYPSRAFDGDSGSLMFGALFAGLAITGGVEIAAIVAIAPAVLNSFYILSSVRGFVERRKMEGRPTFVGEDGKIHASDVKGAPATLVRMILFDGPLGEKDLVDSVLIITAFSCILSVLTSLLTWVAFA